MRAHAQSDFCGCYLRNTDYLSSQLTKVTLSVPFMKTQTLQICLFEKRRIAYFFLANQALI